MVVLLTGFVVVQACSSSTEAPSPPIAGGAGGGGGTGGVVVIKPDAMAPHAGEGGAGELNPLCGVVTCVPDDAQSCADHVPAGGAAEQITVLGGAGGAAGEAAGAAAGTIGQGGTSDEAGAGGSQGGDAAGMAGAGGAGAGGVDAGGVDAGGASTGGRGGTGGGTSGFPSGATGPGVDGGAGGTGPQAPVYACRVVRARNEPITECSPSGRGGPGGPCFDAGDCAAGLTCVSEGTIGRCRPFCCRGESSCDAFPGTYCAERTLLEDPEPRSPLSVPVCVTADACDLAEPPCERSGECECPPGTACQVVRPDGTTSCTKPGEGTAGQACPCAYGYVCSRAANVCLKLCQTNAAEDAGATTCPRCQASAELPSGWGVCIE